MPRLGEISDRTKNLPRSAIRQIWSLARQKHDVVHLEVGEPFETTPQSIIDYAFAKARNGATKYVSSAGDADLRALIAERIVKRCRRPLTPERLVVTTGAIGALYTAFMATLQEGDEVLLPDPGWPNYYAITSLTGAKARTYSLKPENAFEPTIGDLEALITPATRAIVINTPGNPTGAVFSQATMEMIADFVRRHKIYLISDEIYEDIVFEGTHRSAFESGLDEHLWLVSGFSKSFAMTGWRIGWLVVPATAVEACVALQEPLVSCVSAISQSAAIGALTLNESYPRHLAESYRHLRDVLVTELSPTGLLAYRPRGAYYALLNIGELGLNSMDAALGLLNSHRVAAVPGITFGPASDCYLRLAFTADEQRLREGGRRIRDWILEARKRRAHGES
jgi:aspartate aminotransferase/aminotransferase